MSEVRTWGLIGSGTVGGELARQLREKPEVASRLRLSQLPQFVLRSTGLYVPRATKEDPGALEQIAGISENRQDEEYVELLEGVDEAVFPEVMFVATPTEDDGDPAYQYISNSLERGSLVITAEKGAMANYFSELRAESDNFRHLGIDATVGGGTHLISATELYCRDPGNVSQIQAVLNGTLQALFSSMAPYRMARMTLGQAVNNAETMRFVEPAKDGQDQSPYDIIRAEAEGDVPKKIAIFFNALGLSEQPVNWRDLIRPLSEVEIDDAIQHASTRRFIVSIYPKKFQGKDAKGPEKGIIGQMMFEHEGWRIVSGFREIESNALFFPLGTLTGPRNGAVVALGPNESDGDYWTGMGPGAGPGPTANTMMDDYITKWARLESGANTKSIA